VTTTAASTPAPEEVAAAAFATPTTPLPPTHPRPPPARVTVSQPPPSALPSPIAGYAELGVPLEDAVSDALVGGPAAAAAAAPYVVPPVPAVDTEGAVTGGFPGASAAALTIAAAGRIHPGRLFYPGMTYSPSDLVAEEGGGGAAPDGDAAAKASSPAAAQSSGPATTPGFTGSTVAAFAARPPVSGVPPPGVLRVAASDFRNAPLLASLVSATGKLPPRRRTRLAAKDHRALARSIKLARQLALIAPLGRETVDAGPKKFVRPPKRVWREGEGGGGGGGVAATG
jgi:ribosomal protein S18